MKTHKSTIKILNIINEMIDDNTNISLLQKALIKDIIYFNETTGYYSFYKRTVVNKYKEIANENELMKQLKELETEGYITKDIKKTIFNGKFSTKIYYSANLNNIDELLITLSRFNELIAEDNN